MSAESIIYSGELTVVTCWCGMRHAVPAELRRHQERQHANDQPMTSIYCPLGHLHRPAGKSEAQKLREQLQGERDRAARLAAERDQVEASLRAQKAATTRARKRSAAAVCPCCKRSFVQLRRHMETKHPNYKPGS